MTSFLAYFEEQVISHPDALAVRHNDAQVSYKKLNDEANKLAHHLLAEGLTQESVVAIFLNRSTDFLVSIIGTLKAGGAYLPLNPEYPPGRIAQMLKTSDSKFIITSEQHQTTLGEAWNMTSLNCKAIQLIDVLTSATTAENPNVKFGEDNLSYIIFTSGSTGTPKGAMVEHKGMLNHLLQKIELLNITADTRLIQNASQCFDVSVWQFLSPLMVGGEVHILTGTNCIEPTKLFNYVEAQTITILEIVPSQLKSALEWMNEESQVPTLANLKWLVLTGEALPATLCNQWLKRFPAIPMQNAYGPTECSDDVTHHIITAPMENVTRTPIGSAIGNVTLYVTQEDDPTRQVEQGEIGELCVAGIAVGRGYINDEQRTQAVFLNDPFSQTPQRMYRTGDLVREVDPNVFEFVERVDRQVKIRGHRIELGEIEEMLLRHEDISDCAVVATRVQRTSVYYLDNEENQRPVGESAPDRLILAAYIVSPKSIKSLTLSDYLSQSLPSYMLPEQYLEMSALPLTDNGKLDIKSLPAPRSERPKYAGDHVAPNSPLEVKLCQIWEDVLGIDHVGISDNFVNLGGDSLLLVQVTNRIRKDLRVNINFDELLLAENISAICELIAERETKPEIPLTAVATPVQDGAQYPLTYGQQGLWFLWQLAPEAPYYTFQGLLQFHGTLNTQAMEAAFVKLVERHTILRTRFVQTENSVVPQQLICPLSDFTYEKEDFTNRPVDERAVAVRRRAQELSAKAFDLSVEIPFKALQCKLDEQHYAIILTMHEIIMDAWSTTVLIQDIGRLYEHANVNKLDELPMPAVQYYDYAVWEDQFAHPDDLASEEAYWRDQLADAPPLLELPTDRQRPAYPSYRGDSVGVVLDHEFSERIRELGRRENSTLFMTILASYYCLLHFQTGQSDIVIGAPNASRSHGDSEELLGYFLNMLPLRVDMHEGITFRELIGKARDVTTSGIANSRYPFANIVELVDTVDRDTRYSPVFQVMFDMLNFPKIPFKSESLDVQFDELDVGYKKYDIELYTHEQNDQVYLRLSYLDDLFDRETVERMLDSLVAILQLGTANPDIAIAAMPMCSDKELQRILQEFNNTSLPLPSEGVHQLFEQQVEKTPEAIALRCGSDAMTYQALNQQANTLAGLIRDTLPQHANVAMLVDRSMHEVIIMLAALKSGCSYTPLDPEQPDDRLARIAAAADSQLCIVDLTTADRLTELDTNKLNINQALGSNELHTTDNLAWKGTQADIACIIGTSSSTGQPKPTQISHQGVVNRLNWMWQNNPWKLGDTTASLRSTSLVTHLWEIFGGLCQGVETLILTRNEILNADTLCERLSQAKVAGFWSSPSILGLFLNGIENRGKAWPELRYVATGGEAPSMALIRQFQQQLPHTRLINTYGTTEYSSTIATYDMALLSAGGNERVPAGYPIANTQIYILDEYSRPVPIGVHGEVYVGGAGISPGYKGLTEANADSFIANPFSDKPGETLYRTGDRGRLRADGSLEIIGRSTQMVKVRGFRVELEEVASTLDSHADIERCVCRAVAEENTNSIVAYYTAPSALDHQALRQQLNELLPSYMVPKYFMLLEELPLTTSGKVALTELPNPELEVDDSREIVDPRTDTEKDLHAMWENLLNVKPLSITDNFFEVGGHSLIAAQMITAVNRQFGCNLSLQELYRGNSTVEQIANIISDSQSASADNTAEDAPLVD